MSEPLNPEQAKGIVSRLVGFVAFAIGIAAAGVFGCALIGILRRIILWGWR